MNIIELTKEEKRNRLSSLKNEVADFHPYLENLLTKLPRVISVEYTHGRDEKGADFVLTRKDDVIENFEYIGVIVKTGKIHQNIRSIEDQIDECDEERLIQGGKKKIRLDEIWVITNENITSGAKEKIHRKFSTRKIKFYRAKELIELTDKYMDNYWYEIPIDIGDYLSTIELKNQELIQKLSLIESFDYNVYIDQDIIKYEKWTISKKIRRFKKNKKIKKISFLDIISDNKVSILRGGPGFGKTRLLSHLVDFFCKPVHYTKYKIIPIFITFKQLYKEFNGDIEKILNKYCHKNFLQDTTKTFLLCIDGVDEITMKGNEHIEYLTELVNSIQKVDNLKSIITTRPMILFDNQNISESVAVYELAPLSMNKIIKFFEQLIGYANIPERILQDLKKSDLFKELPQTPIAAILLAELLKENSEDLPSNMTELYLKYIELMLGRWDISKGLQSQKEFESARTIIINISLFCIDNNLTYISIDEAKQYFKNYLEKRNLGINYNELFDKVTSRTSILQKDTSNKIVYFKHRTFCEFFYSLSQFNNKNDSFIDNRVYDLYWRNIYFFYIGLQKDCKDVLEKVLSIKPIKESQQLMRVLTMADYFLAGFASEYSVVTTNLSKLLVEAADLYISIRYKKISSPLSNLTPMYLLWLFQLLLRLSYSYNFFSEALDDTAIDICNENNEYSNETKMHALFFLSVISIELGNENPFDLLVKEYKNYLPLHLELALKYESLSIKEKSNILKKQLKKTIKKIQGSRDIQSYIDKLTNKPIKKLKN